MINVLIMADKARLSVIKAHLQLEEDIFILHTTDSITDSEGFAKKAQVIVLDVDEEKAKPFISALKSKKVPIIAVADTAPHGFSMMEWGAADMQVRNPRHQPTYFYKLLAGKIRSVSKKEGGQEPRILKRPEFDKRGKTDKLIVIGSSTGGTDTVEHILKQLPEDIPPILVVQHMPPIFTRMFAERLHNACRISAWEAKNGDTLTRGLALIAPGDYHKVLAKNSEGLYVKCTSGERVWNQRPSVDVLFESVASVLGKESYRSIGVILTGMGSDGAKGLLAMRNMGSATIGQDEASSVVYGMPRVAYECGAVKQQLHLDDIAQAILNFAIGER